MGDYSYVFKYIIIGDYGVGKSAIIERYIRDKFSGLHEVTIGVEFVSKIINVNEKSIKIQMWDTAGHSDYKLLTRLYYQNVTGVLIVYDVNRRDSFIHVKEWLADVKKYNKNEKVVIMLVGNKNDISNIREISTSEGQEFARLNGLLFTECSAKTQLGENKIAKIFDRMAEKIFEKINVAKFDENDLHHFGIRTSLLPVNVMKNSRSTCCNFSIFN